MLFLYLFKIYLDHLFRGVLLKNKKIGIYSTLDMFLYMSHLFTV